MNVLFVVVMNFIKRLCCFNENDEIKLEKKSDNEKKMVESNAIRVHELSCTKIENIKRFTIVTDVNGNTIVKPYSFIYLGYSFIESDTDL